MVGDEPLRSIEERVGIIEERTLLIPEMRQDIKTLLVFVSRFEGGTGLIVKGGALLGVVLGAVSLGMRLLGM